jgi:hypothetical protein
LGWNLRCLFILDGDRKGKFERDRYIREYGIAAERIATVDEFVDGVSEIEDLVDKHALSVIGDKLELKTIPSKNQIRRFFQEHLASDKIVELGSGFESKAKLLIDAIRGRLKIIK